MDPVNINTYSDADFRLTMDTPIPIIQNSLTAPVHMQVRAKADDPTVWLECTIENGRIIISPPTIAPDPVHPEQITIFIPQSILENLPTGVYVYSVIRSTPMIPVGSVVGATGQIIANATGFQTPDPIFRTEMWRGTLTHTAGPTKWPQGTV